jgi:hypothetical protein
MSEAKRAPPTRNPNDSPDRTTANESPPEPSRWGHPFMRFFRPTNFHPAFASYLLSINRSSSRFCSSLIPSNRNCKIFSHSSEHTAH